MPIEMTDVEKAEDAGKADVAPLKAAMMPVPHSAHVPGGAAYYQASISLPCCAQDDQRSPARISMAPCEVRR